MWNWQKTYFLHVVLLNCEKHTSADTEHRCRKLCLISSSIAEFKMCLQYEHQNKIMWRYCDKLSAGAELYPAYLAWRRQLYPGNIYVMLASAVNRISYCNLEMIYFTLKLNCDVIFVCTIHFHFNSIMNVKFTLEFIYLIHFTYQQCSEGHFLKGKDILLSTLYESYLKVICEVTLNIFTRLYHCVVVWRKILDLQSCLQSWFIFCRHDKTKESLHFINELLFISFLVWQV